MERFVNRVHNEIFSSYFMRFPDNDRYHIKLAVASALGDKYEYHQSLDALIGSDFQRNLQFIEAFYAFLHDNQREANRLSRLVQYLLSQSEVDLGIEWKSGQFFRKGAALLDEVLVNDPLRWLRTAGYQSVLNPFENGMSHYLAANGKAELLTVVIADMYESVEALAKIETERNKDLSANRESFVSKVSASDAYKKLLKEYITYASIFRHATKEGENKPQISEREVESFIYLTGVFIRLAMPETTPNTVMNPPPLRR